MVHRRYDIGVRLEIQDQGVRVVEFKDREHSEHLEFNDSDPLIRKATDIMRIVGVIDVRDGRAVHARGGRRDAYAPVGVAAGERVDGDAVALARAYVDVLGVRELYLADLDAIERGIGAMNVSLVACVAALGAPVWVDAGVSTVGAASRVLDTGASMVIVGLETLTSFGAIHDICVSAGGHRVAFSVDLRDGEPITPPNVSYSTRP